MGRRRGGIAAAVVLTLLGGGAAWAAATPAPLPLSRTIGDPSVVQTRTGYVLTATGPSVPRAVSRDGVHWSWSTPALTKLPSWVDRNGGDIWAADIAKVNTYWVLYYAAPVDGITGSSRCIGVAKATSPTAPFVPVGNQPLVCPSQAVAPAGGTRPVAPDQMIDPTPTPTPTQSSSPSQTASASSTASPTTSPKPTTSPTATPTVTPTATPPATPTGSIGAIDPSFFHDPRTGRNWLVYKQDGIPSAIRLVPLRGDGLRIAGPSGPIVSSPWVIENPSVIQVGSTYFLFASVGSWARCSYSTIWMSTRNITAWTGPRQYFLTAGSTGLCGPGGLDIIRTGNTFTAYLEAWTCRWGTAQCPSNFYGPNVSFHGLRSLYGARVVFQNGVPVLTHWLPY